MRSYDELSPGTHEKEIINRKGVKLRSIDAFIKYTVCTKLYTYLNPACKWNHLLPLFINFLSLTSYKNAKATATPKHSF
jgi:hypothetical protein